MSATLTETGSSIQEKTHDLCQAILDDTEVKGHLETVEKFMADEDAKQLYRDVSDHGGMLQQKQHEGAEILPDEIANFERMRDSLLNNPVAKGFIEARESLGAVQKNIKTAMDKTIELGRLPTEEELAEAGCCGGGGGGG